MFSQLIFKALFTQSIFIAVLRHLLTAVGGAVIAQGWATSADWSTASGAVIALAGVLWSALHHAGQVQIPNLTSSTAPTAPAPGKSKS